MVLCEPFNPADSFQLSCPTPPSRRPSSATTCTTRRIHSSNVWLHNIHWVPWVPRDAIHRLRVDQAKEKRNATGRSVVSPDWPLPVLDRSPVATSAFTGIPLHMPCSDRWPVRGVPGIFRLHCFHAICRESSEPLAQWYGQERAVAMDGSQVKNGRSLLPPPRIYLRSHMAS